ncbi:MAG: GNAT family N-acetyltransferase [Flavobacteriales bacterium]|nr:GNAT family N-acetyltransferase [Flavobacteriales bacterium]
MKIISLKKKHLPSIAEMSNQAFGIDYLTYSYFESFLTQNNKQGFVVVDKQKVIAFITIITCSSEDLNQYIFTDSLQMNTEETNNIGIIKQLVVKENYQQKGIASKLIKHCLNNIPASFYIYIAWKKELFTPISQLMNKNGFNPIFTIFQYWKIDSIEKKYHCPTCGNPCICDAIIYITKKQLK